MQIMRWRRLHGMEGEGKPGSLRLGGAETGVLIMGSGPVKHLRGRKLGRFGFLKTDARSSCLHSIYGSHGVKDDCLKR